MGPLSYRRVQSGYGVNRAIGVNKWSIGGPIGSINGVNGAINGVNGAIGGPIGGIGVNTPFSVHNVRETPT